MEWVFTCITLGSVIFIISIVLNYMTSRKEFRSRISRLKDRVEKLEQAIQGEIRLQQLVQSEYDLEKDSLTELKRNLTEREIRVKQGHEQEQKLEMEMYKQEFRRNRT